MWTIFPKICIVFVYRRYQDLLRIFVDDIDLESRNLKLDCSRYGLTLSFTDETHLEEPRFQFYNRFKFDQVPEYYISNIFLEAFTLPEFDGVVEFCFDNSIGLPLISFASFVARLSSVSVIDAPERTIEDLTDLQDELDEQLGDESTVIFPLLKTVILEELGQSWA